VVYIRLLCVAFLVENLIAAPSAHAQYGELAQGALSSVDVSDVHAELCVDHLVDPRSLHVRLPVGYRLMQAASLAASDPAIGSVLQRDSRYTTFVVSTLCFVSAGRFVVDGVPAQTSGPTRLAFWWARADGPPEAHRDARMKGEVASVQLASWYARQQAARARILALDPMAQFVDLDIREADPNLWRVRISLTRQTIEGEVRLSGQRTPMNRPAPAFTTLPFTGAHAAYFQVFTYFGHHNQPAAGVWRAQGSGPLTTGIGTPDANLIVGTVFEDGWQTRAALYKLAR
jgi:hypothetical protein